MPMSSRRRRLVIPPEHSCAYSPHAQATQAKVNVLSGCVMLRLQALDSSGGLAREMHLEFAPNNARFLAKMLLEKATLAEELAK